jgi:hypothetical protein
MQPRVIRIGLWRLFGQDPSLEKAPEESIWGAFL